MQGFVVVPLFAGYDERRGRGRVFSYDVTGGKYEEADFQANGSGGVHARNWIKAQWREDIDRDEAVDLALRALFAAADEDAATGGPDLVRRIFPTRRDHRRRAATAASTTTSSPTGRGAARRARRGGCTRPDTADEERAVRAAVPDYDDAVLRLARAGDEGPRRLRAEGHRARAQPRRVQRRRRHRHRRREPVAHALQDQRDLRPHRVRRRRQVQRVRDAAHRRRPPGRPQGLLVRPRGRERALARERVRADARAGLHARDEAVRGRDPRRAGRRRRPTTTSSSTSSTTAP